MPVILDAVNAPVSGFFFQIQLDQITLYER